VLECSEGGGLLPIPVIEDALDVRLALNRPVRRTQVFTRVPNRNTVRDGGERSVEPASPSLNRLDLVASIGALSHKKKLMQGVNR
jgi:hypothetical protein